MVEAAAVGRVAADRDTTPSGEAGQAGVESAFRAMAMHDVDAQRSGVGGHPDGVERIAQVRLARHRHALDAEFEDGLECREVVRRRLAAGERIDDETDGVPPSDLFTGQVEHVSEQAAERRAQHVQDA